MSFAFLFSRLCLIFPLWIVRFTFSDYISRQEQGQHGQPISGDTPSAPTEHTTAAVRNNTPKCVSTLVRAPLHKWGVTHKGIFLQNRANIYTLVYTPPKSGKICPRFLPISPPFSDGAAMSSEGYKAPPDFPRLQSWRITIFFTTLVNPPSATFHYFLLLL